MNKREAGQLGGITTLTTHGRGFYSAIGKLGGRPRAYTLDEVRQQSASSTNKEMEAWLPTNLKELKMLYRLRKSSSENSQRLGVGAFEFPEEYSSVKTPHSDDLFPITTTPTPAPGRGGKSGN